jgi:Flp pilus assembly protein TadD
MILDHDTQQPHEDLSPEAIQSEVERILASDKFARSKRLRSLLRFTVTQTLQGNAETLKEYVIGTEVLKKPETYDPRSDSLVRVLASRLRVKLGEYYRNGGMEDPLVIGFPKGRYVPVFQRRECFQTQIEQKLRARNAYSSGRLLAGMFTEEALRKSVQHLRAAIDADPSWALPHSALASVCAHQAFMSYGRPRETWALVKASAETALQIDEMSSEAHLCLGLVQGLYERRWKEANAHFNKAIERDSYSGSAHLWRAIAYLIPQGRLSDAQAAIAHLRQLAPPTSLKPAELIALYFSGQYKAVLENTSHLTPSQPGWLGWVRSCALAASGKLDAAICLLKHLQESAPHETRVVSTLGYVYAMAGQSDNAEQILRALREKREQGAWVPSYELALIHVGLGDESQALTYLHGSLREKEPWLAFLAVDPRLSPLRSVPKFTSLVGKVFLDGDARAAMAG